MRVVFMGTPEFAVPILDALHAHHELVAVYTRPDAGSGRGRKVVASPVKARALEAGHPVFQPRTLRDEDVVASLKESAPDAIVVAAYGLILPADVLAIPRHGCINVHASLLPRWRGAAPIQRAILAGDETTGVSIMAMEAGLDTGPTCLMRATPIADKTAVELTHELAVIGAETLLEALTLIDAARAVWSAQPDRGVTYADKLKAADVALAPTQTVLDALRRVRAAGASAPCRIVIGDRRLVVLEATQATTDLSPGAVRAGRHLEIGLSDGALRLSRVVPEGRAAMDGGAFARGARLADDCRWSAV